MRHLQSILERFACAVALLVLAPVFACVAAAILIDSGRPVFFRQQRVGMHGRLFLLLKFRSMTSGRAGTSITVAGDGRVTKVGACIRRLKIDELPQLWNVLRGDMRLIGPRPEVPQYVNEYDPAWQTVLSVRPGITDLATLVFRDEEALLAAAKDPESFYRTTILPKKLALNRQYISSRSPWTDCKLLVYTLLYSLLPRTFTSQAVERQILGSTTNV